LAEQLQNNNGVNLIVETSATLPVTTSGHLKILYKVEFIRCSGLEVLTA